MAKRITSVFLALVLCVCIVIPAFATGFETLIKLEDKSASNSFYSTYGKVYDAATNNEVQFSYTVPSGGATVLLFYSVPSNGNGSVSTFSQLDNAAWAKNSKLNFIAIESANSSAQDVAAFMSRYNKSGFLGHSYYDTDDRHLLMWYQTYIEKDGAIPSDGAIGFNVSFCYAIFITSENGKNYIRYSISGVQSASQIADGLSKVMDTSALAEGYSGYIDSGSPSVGKLSKTQITKLLISNPQKKPSTENGYFDVAPVVSGSYKTGTVKTGYLQAATNRLSALRKIAGLPGVTMDTSMNSDAQYGAVLLAASNFSHYPTQPSGMTDDFFNKGIQATSTSNIAGGSDLTETPDGFMKDEGTNNLPVMGHRRWQLNPVMAKVGFGFAINPDNTYRYYAVEKAHDKSGAGVEYRYISWPASGNFPKQLFDYDTAWSVTLSPSYYQTPDINTVKVNLTRESDGKKWTFSNNETYEVSLYDKYFTVENNGYGVANCIIFRPKAYEVGSEYSGVYTVEISGIKDSFGNSVSLSYQVDFFNTDDYLSTIDGFRTVDGKTYYYKDGTMLKGWQDIKRGDGKTYKHYFGSNGVMRTGWQDIKRGDGKTYKHYFDSYGRLKTGWQKIKRGDGKTYQHYFDSAGRMKTGWQKLKRGDGKTYMHYFDSAGRLKTGWQNITNADGKTNRYYFDSAGRMKTGWQSIKNSKGVACKYYFGSNGVMRINWQSIKRGDGKTYKHYFGSNGVMRTGWQTISNKKYYFKSSGIMVTGNYKIGNKTYRFNSSGVCLNP